MWVFFYEGDIFLYENSIPFRFSLRGGTASTLIDPYRVSTPFPFAGSHGKGFRFPHALSAGTKLISTN